MGLLRNRSSIKAFGVGLALLVTGVAGCGDATEPGLGAITMHVQPSSVMVEVFGTGAVQVEFRRGAVEVSAPAPVVWTSRDEHVAGVNGQGEVTGLGVGETHLVVQSGELIDSVTATVTAPGVVALSVPDSLVLGEQGRISGFAVVTDTLGRTIPGLDVSLEVASGSGFAVAGDEVVGVEPGTGFVAVHAGTASAEARVVVVPGYEAIVAGELYICLLRLDGRAECGGNTADGRLGRPPSGLGTAPVEAVETDLGFESLTAGRSHTCGLTADGRAHCWGSNAVGRLGAGIEPAELTSSAAVLPVAGEHSFTRLSAAERHTCGLTTGGELYCWGDNNRGQLGEVETPNCDGGCTVVPARTAEAGRFEALSTGLSLTCGLDAEGAAYCWGNAGFTGAHPDTIAAACDETTCLRPLPVNTATRFTELGSAFVGATGLTSSGGMWWWGSETPAPIRLPFSQPVTALGPAQSSHHVCGVTQDGLAAWVRVVQGDLSQSLPSPEGFRFQAVSAGWIFQMCGIDEQNVAYCWNHGEEPVRVDRLF